ncbi:MAG: ankyrin repeat domain-containing protein [Magnetococcus sp. DMHC-6]
MKKSTIALITPLFFLGFGGIKSSVAMHMDEWFIHAAQRGNNVAVKMMMNNNVPVDILMVQHEEEGEEHEEHGKAEGHEEGPFVANSTAIMWAAGYGWTDMIQTLLERGAEVDRVDANGQTALMWAINGGRFDAVALLVGNGADLSIQDKSGRTALDYAMEQNRPQLVDFLKLSNPHKAIQGNKKIESEAEKTAKKEHEEEGESHEYQQKHGLSPENEWLEVDPALTDASPVRKAAASGNIAFLQEQIKKGQVDLNARNEKGETALILAAREGRADVVALLVNAKVDLTAVDSSGMDALMWAAWEDWPLVVQHLAQAGAKMDVKDPQGRTPLHLAAQNNRVQAVKALIAAEADVNAKDLEENTPLMLAVMGGHQQTAVALLQRGANVNLRNKHMKSPTKEAENKNFVELVMLLKKAGGN